MRKKTTQLPSRMSPQDFPGQSGIFFFFSLEKFASPNGAKSHFQKKVQIKLEGRLFPFGRQKKSPLRKGIKEEWYGGGASA